MRVKLILLILTCSILFAWGQSDSSETPVNPFDSMEEHTSAYEPAPDWIRHHKRLHSGYSGYFIELKQTPTPLTRSDSTLQMFGVIHYDERPDDSFSYGIIADFDRKDSFRKYVREVIIPKSDEVRLFRYRYGKRKEMRLK